MKVLVVGAAGQLGSDVVRALQEKGVPFVAANRKDVDITNKESLSKLVEKEAPNAVVNCAAFHDVEKCEEDPSLAMAINAEAVATMAEICDLHQIKFLTLSSDYVFDGKKLEGYTEEDLPNPIMHYGHSKLAGERGALEKCSKAFVVRVQSLYGETPPSGKGLHFVDLMMKISLERDELQVDQCRMAPTWTIPLAHNLIALLHTDHFGLYHMSAQGSTSWCAFAEEIMKLSRRGVKVTPVSNDHFPRNFARPENTYLVNENLDKIGFNHMPSWQECLEGYLKAKYHI